MLSTIGNDFQEIFNVNKDSKYFKNKIIAPYKCVNNYLKESFKKWAV